MRPATTAQRLVAAAIAGLVVGASGLLLDAAYAQADQLHRLQTPMLVTGWKSCDPVTGRWEITWTIANLGPKEAVINALDGEVSGITPGSPLPAYKVVSGTRIVQDEATEVSLEVEVGWDLATGEASPQVLIGSDRATLTLSSCAAARAGWPPWRPRSKPESSEPVTEPEAANAQIYYHAGCDALVFAASGTDDGQPLPIFLTPSSGGVASIVATAGTLSNVAPFDAVEGLSVRVEADGVSEVVNWQKPNDCPGAGGIPTGVVITAVLAGAAGLLALGIILLTRSRSER